MSDIKKRIELLRKRMEKEGIFAYYIPTSDFHSSEYVSDYFKVREYFSGFTGSAGDLLITLKEAVLWTDGRYFIQAEKELEGSGIRLFKSGQEGVPDIYGYLKKELPKKAVLGFDGRTVDADRGRKLKKCAGKTAYKKDLTDGIFTRPPFPSSNIRNLPDDITGESAVDKLGRIREKLKKEGAKSIFISRLDDIAYILNIRGDDVKYNPVVMSYLYITDEKTYIFTGNGKADIGYHGIIVKPYTDVERFLEELKTGGKVSVDTSSVSYLHYRILKKRARLLCRPCPSLMMKAVKNRTEILHLKDIYIRDSLALTRFIKWLDENKPEITETEAAEKLLSFRKEIPGFNDLSFETISAYGENAAIIHYAPKEGESAVIGKKGFYMVDSGGQYDGGTTDVTRTIVTGKLSDEEKEAFTIVASGMLAILNCVFLKGTKGFNLDILARQAMWKRGIDYKHGTGHGVGYMLNVHEGPHAIRMKPSQNDAALEPGMLISDEPGIYKEGRFGVRTENILLVKEDKKTEDGCFYSFENLTFVPIDHRAMDYAYLSDSQIKEYERYQKDVYDTLSPMMNEDEKEWLKAYSGIHN